MTITILKCLINIWSSHHRYLTLSRLLVKLKCAPVLVNSWFSSNWCYLFYGLKPLTDVTTLRLSPSSNKGIWQSESALVDIWMDALIWNYEHKYSFVNSFRMINFHLLCWLILSRKTFELNHWNLSSMFLLNYIEKSHYQ